MSSVILTLSTICNIILQKIFRDIFRWCGPGINNATTLHHKFRNRVFTFHIIARPTARSTVRSSICSISIIQAVNANTLWRLIAA